MKVVEKHVVLELSQEDLANLKDALRFSQRWLDSEKLNQEDILGYSQKQRFQIRDFIEKLLDSI